MKKGIWIGNGLTIQDDLQELISIGFDTLFIEHYPTLQERLQVYKDAKQLGIKTFVVSIADALWKETIDEIDAEFYYIDEPYEMGHVYSPKVDENELKCRLQYVLDNRPNSKFVISGLRHIQKKSYTPIPDLYYTYSSYTDNWYLPIIDIAVPFGFGNQTPAIKRIYKKVGGKMPFLWIYGQNKLLCHPDEYHKLFKTAEDLGIPLLMLYIRDGGSPQSKYIFNKVSHELLMKNISNFISNKKPYTFTQWWKRLFYRLRLSFGQLFRTWNFKEFIDKLF